jgi:hypothetical protein
VPALMKKKVDVGVKFKNKVGEKGGALMERSGTEKKKK